MKKSVKIIASVALTAVLIVLVVYCAAFGKSTEESAVQTEEQASEITAEEALTEAKGLAEAAEAAWQKQNAVKITLADGKSSSSSPSVQIEGNKVTLTESGTYRISGTLSDGQIIADVEENVILILDGADIGHAEDAAISVTNAKHALIYLPEGSENSLISGTEQEIVSAADNSDQSSAEGAALYARDNLSIAGEGSLTIGGYINNGIATTDRLTLLKGSLTVEAVNNGLKGKDSVLIIDGTLNVTSGNDGIKSNNDTDEGCGSVDIRGGTVNLSTCGDGVQAARELTVEDGVITVAAGDLSESGMSGTNRTENNMPDDFGNITGSTLFAGIDGITENSDGTVSVSQEAAEKILSMAAEAFGETDITAEQIEACTSYDALMELFKGDIDAQMPGNMTEPNGGAEGMTPPEMPNGENNGGAAQPGMPDGGNADGTAQPGMPNGENAGGTTPPEMPDGGNIDSSAQPTRPGDRQAGNDTATRQPPAAEQSSEADTSEGQGGRQNTGGDFADMFDREWSNSGSDDSTKGLKSGGDLTVTGGSITVTSADDCLHADGSVTLTGGGLTLSSGDDGIHADDTLTIEGADITVTKSYEGLEAHLIYIKGGNISVTASDDGMNASGGSSMFGAIFSSGSDDDSMSTLQITDGSVYVNAGGDGLDSNGDLIIDGGSVVVDGPSDNGNGALDSGSENGGSILCNGGTVLAIGGSGMAEVFESDSAQPSFIYNFSGSLAAGSEITVSDAQGNVIFTHTAAKSFNSVVFSSPDLTVGTGVTLTAGDQTVEIDIDGITNGNSTGSSFGGGMRGGFGRR